MIKPALRKLKRMLGAGLLRSTTQQPPTKLAPDFEPSFLSLHENCSPFTMTSPERMYALHKAIAYISSSQIDGDIVECGVWRGGSSMMTALTLKSLDDTARKIYLYDTFKGMTKPSGEDRKEELEKWERNQSDSFNNWAYAPLDDVKNNMARTGYPHEKIFFIEGEVEKTIPKAAPEKISLLRLDTDWFESTYHELVHLFPRLVKGGILILDDYGSKQGAKRAVDKYFAEQGFSPFLMRIDATGRMLIK